MEDRVEPVGVGDATPEFSWVPQDRSSGAVQSAYQILVASTPGRMQEDRGDLWDSGKVASRSTAFVAYAGARLASGDVYYWKVRTWDDADRVGPYSEPASFEMGLLSTVDWQARWIWRKSEEPDDYTYFRRTVHLEDKPIARARVYVSATHRHELSINGRPVGNGPNFAYPEEQYYQTFAVESFLRPGDENVLALLCHWYGPGQGRPESRRGLILQAVVDYTDGTESMIATDAAWKVRRGEWHSLPDPVRNESNGVPMETIDGRGHPVGWRSVGFDDSRWSPAEDLGPHPTPPWTATLRAQETQVVEYEIPPVSVHHLAPRRWVADFGKVYAGRPVVRLEGLEPGTEILVTTGYRTHDDGSVVGMAQKTDMTYRYLARGGGETFRPYWYLGFRYVQVDGTPGPHDASTIRLIVRHHDVDTRRSSFESSDPTLNAIWSLLERSVRLGSQEQFIDTPTREQAQFTYDAYMTALAAMKLFGERDLGQQALREFAESQEKFFPATGEINCVYPNGDGAQPIPDWTQIYVVWLWDYYQETGDREILADLFENAVRVGHWVKSTEDPVTGLVDVGTQSIWDYRSGLIDWPDPYDYDVAAAQRTVLSLNAYLDYWCIGELARELGRTDIARQFRVYAADILQAIQDRLWDDEKNAYVDGLHADGSRSRRTSQQSNMMMLALGLAYGERIAGAMAAVKRAGHASSPLLVRYLIRAYGEYDEDESLLDFLTNPEGRNWAFILADGGTFTYEGWEGRRRPRETSESHPFGALAGIIALQEYVLGVQRTGTAFTRFRVRPHIMGLRYARGTIPTQLGEIGVDWRVEGGAGGESFRMTLRVPVNASAAVYVPLGKRCDSAVRVDGVERRAQPAGRYLLVEGVGSGEHEIVR